MNVTHLHAVNLLGGAGEEVTVLVSREKFDDDTVGSSKEVGCP